MLGLLLNYVHQSVVLIEDRCIDHGDSILEKKNL
jgi:hypothetical protein